VHRNKIILWHRFMGRLFSGGDQLKVGHDTADGGVNSRVARMDALGHRFSVRKI
jgi:hypothetical protein